MVLVWPVISGCPDVRMSGYPDGPARLWSRKIWVTQSETRLEPTSFHNIQVTFNQILSSCMYTAMGKNPAEIRILHFFAYLKLFSYLKFQSILAGFRKVKMPCVRVLQKKNHST